MDAFTELEIQFRHPRLCDADAVWRLVNDSGVLDRNSLYLYLLLCRDFAETCLIAEINSEVAGFVTGYHPPSRPHVLFVWQVGVKTAWRRHGIAGRLLSELLQRSGKATGMRFLETTVAATNAASRGLFQRLAARWSVPLSVVAGEGFGLDLFADGNHEAEPLIRIGPFDFLRE